MKILGKNQKEKLGEQEDKTPNSFQARTFLGVPKRFQLPTAINKHKCGY